MTVQLLFRFVGMIAFGVLGWQLGLILGGHDKAVMRDVLAMALLFSGLGVVITPWLTVHPYRRMRQAVIALPAEDLVSATIGLITGLILAALLSFPLGLLPSPLLEVATLLVTFLLCYSGVAIMLLRRRELGRLVSGLRARASTDKDEAGDGDGIRATLLDTSAIIDGRVADISRTGFIFGTIVVPRFILNELQHIADSPDPLRRNRGRRGLDMLSKLQKDSLNPVRIADFDANGITEVDDKLVSMAKEMHWPVITNDINLNRVAQLQGVTVLNINELANAVKTVVLPGEGVRVRIIQEGKEPGQGVGYLDDGTMVVVENGRRYLNATLEVGVTKVLQTAAGRMIFASPTRD
ncbi:MAG: PIN domain nuclease [Anaerolineae bacterium]